MSRITVQFSLRKLSFDTIYVIILLILSMMEDGMMAVNAERIYQMDFAMVYPLLINKAIRKGRTKAEADEIIRWLTGYTQDELQTFAAQGISYADFFNNAPQMNPNRRLITGSVCGVKVETIEEPLMREIRYLDKLIDELAKGKPMEKILRK